MQTGGRLGPTGRYVCIHQYIDSIICPDTD